MSMVLAMLAVGLGLFALALLAGTWLVRSHQLDDLDTPALRMLSDDVAVAPQKPITPVQEGPQ